MSANTPYFYMRLKADFFESDEISYLKKCQKVICMKIFCSRCI